MTYGGNIVDWMLMVQGEAANTLPIDYIRSFVLDTVASACGVTAADIKGSSQKAELVRPRHIAAWALYQPVHNGHSNPYGAQSIGRFLNRHHATIVHGNKQIKNVIEVDKVGRWQVAVIAAELHRGGYHYAIEKFNKTVLEWDKAQEESKKKKLRKT